MTLDYAIELGASCGCNTPHEAVELVMIYWDAFFNYNTAMEDMVALERELEIKYPDEWQKYLREE